MTVTTRKIPKPLLVLFIALFVFGSNAVLLAQSATTDPAPEAYPGQSAIQQMYDAQAQRAKDFAPKVLTLKNGTQIQRTPTEYNAGVYHSPGKSISYNTYYLKADSRGCGACHADLGKLVSSMSYKHVNLQNALGIETTVNQCLSCHSFSPGYVTETYGFGTLIHGIHKSDRFKGDCMSCHNATGDGKGMELWDQVKHDVLRGILPVEKVSGDFSFTQDKVLSQEQTFSYNWMYYEYDYQRNGAAMVKAPLDPKVFNDWTIKVTGDVAKPFEIKLPDLIKEAPSVTTTMAMHCTMNPMGGPLIANCKVTGVPLSYLLDKAQIKPDATVLLPTAIDGFAIPTAMDLVKKNEAYLVYQIDGQPLSQVLGYPVQIWLGGAAASSFVKQVVDIQVHNEPVSDFHLYQGWVREKGGFYNKPNIGLCQVQEGQIIEAGKPFRFEGYADAYEQPISAVEFSMDKGKTWTSYSTTGAKVGKWTYWNFSFTPPDEGAYVLMARAVTKEGLVSDPSVEVMVVAKKK
jgi:DMSO/TMAO reductase YedYZ molybdopterin-dependent catalytic subunit